VKFRNITDRELYSPAGHPAVVGPDAVAEFPAGAEPSPDLWAPVNTKGRKADAEKE